MTRLALGIALAATCLVAACDSDDGATSVAPELEPAASVENCLSSEAGHAGWVQLRATNPTAAPVRVAISVAFKDGTVVLDQARVVHRLPARDTRHLQMGVTFPDSVATLRCDVTRIEVLTP